MSAIAARVPRQPITFLYGNLVWGPFSDEVWAVYGLEMQSYEGRPRRGKVDLMGDLADAADGLEADFQLLRITRQWSLEDYVAGADATIDARHGHPAEWHAVIDAQRARLEGRAVARPEVYLAVRLSHSARTVEARVAAIVRAQRRDVWRDLKRGLGLSDPRGLREAQLADVLAEERDAYHRLADYVACERASTATLQWLVERSLCRGLGEPEMDEHFQPQAIVLDDDGDRRFVPLEHDVLRLFEPRKSPSAAGLGGARGHHRRPRCPDRRRRRRRPAALRRAAHHAPRLRSLGRDRDQRLSRVSGSRPPRCAEARRRRDRRADPLGTALVLLVATLMGGLAPQGCGPTSNFTPSAVALADIPGNYLGWIRGAAPRYGLDWTVIAGIYSIESDFGRLDAPGVRSGENFAGAGGPGQFLEATWARYGVDGDGDGVKDRYHPADAIPATANLLHQNGAPGDYGRAIFAYNHAGWYVNEVLSRAARYRGAARDNAAADFVAVADVAPAAACANAATGPADLSPAVRLTSPAAYRALPPWAMAGGRPAEPVDARIHDDVLWVLRRYGLRVSAARETGHHTHGDGTALDLVPAVGAAQADWDMSAGRLANDLGWTTNCGSAGVRPACALKPAIQFIGYDGYPSHGSPRTCTGGCPVHIHVSWVSGCYGSSALVEPCGWVMAFPVPVDAAD